MLCCVQLGNTNFWNQIERQIYSFFLSLNTEYASSSDSESEQQLVDQAWRGDVDSDAESIDSEQEDSLKYVTKITEIIEK